MLKIFTLVPDAIWNTDEHIATQRRCYRIRNWYNNKIWIAQEIKINNA